MSCPVVKKGYVKYENLVSCFFFLFLRFSNQRLQLSQMTVKGKRSVVILSLRSRSLQQIISILSLINNFFQKWDSLTLVNTNEQS